MRGAWLLVIHRFTCVLIHKHNRKHLIRVFNQVQKMLFTRGHFQYSSFIHYDIAAKTILLVLQLLQQYTCRADRQYTANHAPASATNSYKLPVIYSLCRKSLLFCKSLQRRLSAQCQWCKSIVTFKLEQTQGDEGIFSISDALSISHCAEKRIASVTLI